MRSRIVVVLALAACGGKKAAAPDAAAICAGTVTAKDTIVLHVSDPAASGKANGLRELAARLPQENRLPLSELDRFLVASDAAAIFTAHVEERERKVREDLESARIMVQVLREAQQRERATDNVLQPAAARLPEDWPFASELRFPSMIGTRAATADIGARVAELTKPLTDRRAMGMITERAKALATSLGELSGRVASIETAPDEGALRVPIYEAIKIANIAHHKLNEAVAALHTNVATLAALADENNGRRYAEAIRLWTRLAAITARLADPWPTLALRTHSRAFVIAGPRQAIVVCSAPGSYAPPAAILTAVKPITIARDSLGVALGHALPPAPPGSLAALGTALEGTRAPAPPKP